MSIVQGAITSVINSDGSVTVTTAAPTGGTGPYTYQWYRAESPQFTPNGQSLISGATGLSYTDKKLRNGSRYYYKCVYTDSVAATAPSLDKTADTIGKNGTEGVIRKAALFGSGRR